jgi:hypothetical protein
MDWLLLRCLDEEQAKIVMGEVHEGMLCPGCLSEWDSTSQLWWRIVSGSIRVVMHVGGLEICNSCWKVCCIRA